MKILLVTAEYGEAGGGLSAACCQFHRILTKGLGHDVSICSSTDCHIATASGGYNTSLESHISNEYRLKTDILKYSSIRVDLIIAFGGSFNGYYATILAKSLNTRLYLMLRGTDINLAKWNEREMFYLKNSTAVSEKVICLSNEMKKNIKLFLPEVGDKCIIIPNIISSMPQIVSFPNYPKRLIIGCSAAHINEKKGIANLFHVVRAIKSMIRTPVVLYLVGEIDADLKFNYNSIASDLDLVSNVVYTGYMSRPEFVTLQKNWDIYIQTSVCEGFCNSVAEALSDGTPIYISSTGYISEVLKENYPLLVYDSFEPYKIASGLMVLLNLPDKEEYYRKAYSEVYSITNRDRVTDLWKNVLSNHVMLSRVRYGNIRAVALHDVDGELHDNITTPIDVFARFVDRLYKRGIGLCSFQDYIAMNVLERNRWVVCTFDDGYVSLIDNVLPILNKYGFTATVFVNTQMIGKDNSWNWKDSKRRLHLDEGGIKELVRCGWEIGSHGHTHRNHLQLSEEELAAEFSTSLEILHSMVGNITTYAYPYGEHSEYVQQVCKRYFRYAFALQSGGTELEIDNMKIRRYFIDDIIKILGL